MSAWTRKSVPTLNKLFKYYSDKFEAFGLILTHNQHQFRSFLTHIQLLLPHTEPIIPRADPDASGLRTIPG